MARRIDGRAIAAAIAAETRARVAALAPAAGRAPGLALLLVGERADSAAYVRAKRRALAAAGMLDFSHALPASAPQAEVMALVRRLSADARVDGVVVQLPLPPALDAAAVLAAVAPEKDVDGLHPLNAGLLALAGCGGAPPPPLVACTPAGVMELLRRSGVALAGAHAVVLGRSSIVGTPMAALLRQAHATVTVCHSRTRDVPAHVARADVLVAAVGRPRLVQGTWLKPGAVVIDVGINEVLEGGQRRIVGDCDFESCARVAGAISPVPGGVGPMTIAMLLRNCLAAYEARVAAACP